jgi:hypothetical protein
MDFLKKHYEKVLLGVVLLGLVAALLLLPFMIAHDQEELDNASSRIIKRTVKPLPPLDLTRETNILDRLQAPCHLDFETTNKLFNPVQWQKTPDGRLIKLASGSEIGLAVVTRITPLYFVLNLDSVTTNEFGARYVISVERQAASSPALRRRQQRFVSMDDRKKDVFTLLNVKGAPENPGQLVVQLADTGETVSLSKDKPFQRVDGYLADLKYDPEGKKWQGQHAGAELRFAGGGYIIVAISQSEVILSAESNQKKTTLPYQP